MTPKSEPDWLKSAILDLPFSSNFKMMAINNRLKTLQQMVDTETHDLLKLPGFSYHCLQEYIQFLEERKMTHLLRQ